MLSSRCRFPAASFLQRKVQIIAPLGISCKRYCGNTSSLQVPTPWFDAVLTSLLLSSRFPALLISILENSRSTGTVEEALSCILRETDYLWLGDFARSILKALPSATPEGCEQLLRAAVWAQDQINKVFSTPAAVDIILDAALNNCRNNKVINRAVYLMNEAAHNDAEAAHCFTTPKTVAVLVKLTPTANSAWREGCLVILRLLDINEEPAFKLFGTSEVRGWLARISSVEMSQLVVKRLDELEAKYGKKPIEEEKKSEKSDNLTAIPPTNENQNLRLANISEDQVVSFLSDPNNLLSPDAIRKLLTHSKSPDLIYYAIKKIKHDISIEQDLSAFADAQTATAILAAMPHATTAESSEMIFRVAGSVAKWSHPSRHTFSTPEAVDIIFDAVINNAKSSRCLCLVMELMHQLAYCSQRRSKNLLTPKCASMLTALIPYATNTQSGRMVCDCIDHLISQNAQVSLELFGNQKFLDAFQTMDGLMNQSFQFRDLREVLDWHIFAKQ